MRIGIIVHSQTGNTFSVAERLQGKLSAAGHTVELKRLETLGEVKPGAKDIRFKGLPDIETYDALVFGAPVQAFSLSPVMQSYLGQVGAVQGKKVVLLLTQHFPFAWMGGNRALGQMRKSCESNGAVVCGTGIVHWSKGGRDQQIANVVSSLSQALS